MSLTKLQKLQLTSATIAAIFAELIADELAATATPAAASAVLPAVAVPAAVAIPPATMAAPPSQRHVPPLGAAQRPRPFPAGARRVTGK